MTTNWQPARQRQHLVWVLLAHAALLWGWLSALQHSTVEVRPPERANSLLRLLPMVAAPQQAAARQQPPVRATTSKPSAAGVATPPSVTPPPAVPTTTLLITSPTPPPTPLAAAPSQDTPAQLPLLQTEASRRALRDFARQPLLSERAASATDQLPATTAGQLARQVGGSLQGDCSKGQFLGAGMALLSLPFLVAAEVSGRCAR